VIVDDAEAAADTLLYFDPASKTIQEVSFKEHRVQPYGTALPRIIPPWMNYTRQFIDAIDTKLVAATRSPSQMPGVPLAVEQNPSQWGALAGGGATVTEKILAPDGSYTAGQIGGTNGGTVTLFGVATVLALNDWIIAGGWLQSSELDKRPANYRLDLAAGGNPYYINGTSNQTGEEIGLRYGPYNVGDQAWKFVLTALKITTEGTAPVFPRLFLRRDTDYGITNYWMPGMILVPARLGFTDAEVMALARSLTAWPSVCLSGDVALAPHQQLRLGGGAQLFSAPAVPTSGVFARGAQILHSDLAVGEPTGWRATVAGGATSTTRANTTVYAVGVWALWTTGTTVWECIVAGTSAGAAPSIVGKLPGDTVVDNTVTWRMMSLTRATLVALANL
jgi:hypothetical protein